MKKKLFILGATAVAFTALVLASCAKDMGKLPEPAPAGTLSCDTITYTKHIKAIVDANCAIPGCHDGSNSNPLMSTYEQVKDRAEAGRIQARVIDQQPSSMPPLGNSNPVLTAEQKALISCWLGNGYKE
ncbi:hypothetical protein CNR22_17370 [Sphingobacteriaceae bacterium]|nr:hypothetical protein CNR22_17370 [Sphingobacteriaceae bacterium]